MRITKRLHRATTAPLAEIDHSPISGNGHAPAALLEPAPHPPEPVRDPRIDDLAEQQEKTDRTLRLLQSQIAAVERRQTENYNYYRGEVGSLKGEQDGLRGEIQNRLQNLEAQGQQMRRRQDWMIALLVLPALLAGMALATALSARGTARPPQAAPPAKTQPAHASVMPLTSTVKTAAVKPIAKPAAKPPVVAIMPIAPRPTYASHPKTTVAGNPARRTFRRYSSRTPRSAYHRRFAFYYRR